MSQIVRHTFRAPRPPPAVYPTMGEPEARGGWDLPKVTQRVVSERAELAEPQCPGYSYTNCPMRRRRRRRRRWGQGNGGRRRPWQGGSPGSGWEWERGRSTFAAI